MESQDKRQTTIEDIFRKKWFWITFFGIIFIWWLNWYLIDVYFEMQDGGVFGDRFGATTSLFSGFTILGLIVTILLQREQISLQRTEIESQRKQMEEEKIDYQKEREVTIFFELMNLQNTALENISGETTTGRNTLVILRNVLRTRLSSENLNNIANINNYLSFVETTGHFYLHYIRAIQTTFEHIVFSKILDDGDKRKFITILRSQLSKIELVLWGYEIHLRAFSKELVAVTIKYEMFVDLEEDVDAPLIHVQTFKRKF